MTSPLKKHFFTLHFYIPGKIPVCTCHISSAASSSAAQPATAPAVRMTTTPAKAATPTQKQRPWMAPPEARQSLLRTESAGAGDAGGPGEEAGGQPSGWQEKEVCSCQAKCMRPVGPQGPKSADCQTLFPRLGVGGGGGGAAQVPGPARADRPGGTRWVPSGDATCCHGDEH
jgi:hypothetical protein